METDGGRKGWPPMCACRCGQMKIRQVNHQTPNHGSFLGSTPLHLATRSGSLDYIRELLAWGVDRLQIDAARYLCEEEATTWLDSDLCLGCICV
ncbi:hypothetical protein ACS0TY_033487 [Phlomoides rotata]